MKRLLLALLAAMAISSAHPATIVVSGYTFRAFQDPSLSWFSAMGICGLQCDFQVDVNSSNELLNDSPNEDAALTSLLAAIGNQGSVVAWHNGGGGTPNELNILAGIEADVTAGVPNIGVGAGHYTSPTPVTCNGTAASLASARTGAVGTGRISITLWVQSAVAVTIGLTNGVTNNAGFVLPASMAAPITLPVTGAVWCITGGSSATVSVMEIY